MQLLRKISRDTVYGGKGELLELIMSEKDKQHPVMRVVGYANGIKAGSSKQKVQTTDGEAEVERAWKALTGDFQATNSQTGQIFRSGVCFAPEFVVDMVHGQLSADDDIESVTVAYDLVASYDETSATSYVYDVVWLQETAENDPLNALAAQVDEIKQLAPPTED
jgi:hypothetical protein